jgi:hypothetical protein
MDLLCLSKKISRARCRHSREDGDCRKGQRQVTTIKQVITWDNVGERHDVHYESLEDAKRLAKERRILENKTVKICDSLGTLYHWSRVVGVKSNRWIARAVVNDVFI